MKQRTKNKFEVKRKKIWAGNKGIWFGNGNEK